MADTRAISKEISSKLRGYNGLTADRLAGCPALLEVLGTSDPFDALARFKAALDRLPDDRYTGSLKNALRLDPDSPSSLTGAAGRRSLYGRFHFVSEETVKAWESKAIAALVTELASRPAEWLEGLLIVFFIANGKITYKSETRVWNSGSDARTDTENFFNKGALNFPFAAYQLAPDETPAELELYVLFDDLPAGAFTVPGVNLFEFLTGEYDRQRIPRAYPARDLLGNRVETPADHPLNELSGYMMKWEQPQPSSIYGVAWY